MDKMRVSISKHYQEIMDRDNFVTADKAVSYTHLDVYKRQGLNRDSREIGLKL